MMIKMVMVMEYRLSGDGTKGGQVMRGRVIGGRVTGDECKYYDALSDG